MNSRTLTIGGFLILSFLQVVQAAPSNKDESELRCVYLINYASASYLAGVINEVYGAGETLLTPDQIYGFRRSGLADLTEMADSGVITSDSPFGVKADFDDYSNAVIVRANAEQQSEIAAFLHQVDHADPPVDYPYIIPLTYVRAQDMAPVVQEILDGSTPIGRSAAADGDSGNVTADITTNTLIVVTDEDTIVDVESVLAQLDCAPSIRGG